MAIARMDRFHPVGWLYGSGVDRMPRLIEQLAGFCPLYGNRAEGAEICTCPQRFFALLDRLQIAYPEIRWESAGESGWLVKQGGEGGRGVRVASGLDRVDGAYLQRRMQEPAYTLAFVAGGGRLLWFGFNRLYTSAYNDQWRFLFSGAINRVFLDPQVRDRVIAYARRLCESLNLQGWHGMDFMLDASGHPRVLELNPRPGAALWLWDEPGWPCLEAHLRGAAGKSPRDRPAGKVRAFRILYAEEPLQIPQDWRWPGWCADLPSSGRSIPAGQPVCSVLAAGDEVALVEAELERRIYWLKQSLLNRTTAEVDKS